MSIFCYLQTTWHSSTDRGVPKISSFESERWSFYSGQSHISSQLLSQHPREEKDNEDVCTIFKRPSQKLISRQSFSKVFAMLCQCWEGCFGKGERWNCRSSNLYNLHFLQLYQHATARAAQAQSLAQDLTPQQGDARAELQASPTQAKASCFKGGAQRSPTSGPTF